MGFFCGTINVIRLERVKTVRIAFNIVQYVLTAFGLYTIARRRGVKMAWLAWVPLLNYVTVYEISDQYQRNVLGQEKNKVKTSIVLWIAIGLMMALLYACALVTTVRTGAPMILMFGIIACLIGWLVLTFLAERDLFRSCGARYPALLAVLSFVNIVFAVLLLVYRNRDNGLENKEE